MRKKRLLREMCRNLLKLYRAYLKPLPLVHALFLRLYWCLLPVFLHALSYTSKYSGARIYKLVKLSDLVKIKKIRKRIIVEEETVLNHEPKVFPAGLKVMLACGQATDIFPEIFITTIRDVKVIGGSNIIFSKGRAIIHDLFDVDADATSEELHARYMITPKSKKLIQLRSEVGRRFYSRAAVFTDACSMNYAHWLTEVLPRIYLYYASGASLDSKIIIDRNLHPNLLESLELVAGGHVSAFKLHLGRTASVDELSVVSVAGYVPFGRRNKKMESNQGRFSPTTFQGMVRKIRLSLGIAESDGWRKLYVRRSSKVRALSNLEEIERILIDQGYEVIEPETLSFSEQVRTFSEAAVVVGTTGAAMANLIFTQPNAKIIIMMGIHKDMPYRYWQNMAASVGRQVYYVLGEITGQGHYGIHADFRIGSADLLAALASN